MCHCVCLCRLHVPLGRPASAFGTDPASTTIRSRCPTIIPMINCRNHVRAVSFSRVPRKPSIPRTHGQGHFCRRGLPNWSADTQMDYLSAAVYICLAAGTPVAIESAWRELVSWQLQSTITICGLPEKDFANTRCHISMQGMQRIPKLPYQALEHAETQVLQGMYRMWVYTVLHM